MLKSIQLTITASEVAWYAAIVATVGAAIQIAAYFRDRARLEVTFQREMQYLNDPLHPPDTVFTIITITNVGRRPVTVRNIGLQKRGRKGAILTDVQPMLPHELTEGKFAVATLDETGLDMEEVAYFAAWYSAGRMYCAPVAKLHRRFWWAIRRKFLKVNVRRNQQFLSTCKRTRGLSELRRAKISTGICPGS